MFWQKLCLECIICQAVSRAEKAEDRTHEAEGHAREVERHAREAEGRVREVEGRARALDEAPSLCCMQQPGSNTWHQTAPPNEM